MDNPFIVWVKIPPLVVPFEKFEVAYCILATLSVGNPSKYKSNAFCISPFLLITTSFEPNSDNIFATVYMVILFSSFSLIHLSVTARIMALHKLMAHCCQNGSLAFGL